MACPCKKITTNLRCLNCGAIKPVRHQKRVKPLEMPNYCKKCNGVHFVLEDEVAV